MDKPRITIRLSPSSSRMKVVRRTESRAMEAEPARPQRLAVGDHVSERAIEPDRPSLPPEAPVIRSRPASSDSLAAFRVRRNGKLGRFPWATVAWAAVPLVGAVGLGLLLGWSMLTLLRDPGSTGSPAAANVSSGAPAAPAVSSGETPQPKEPAEPVPTPNRAPAPGDGNGSSGSGALALAQEQASPPARTLAIVQAGVFQTREAAERMRQTLATRGVPAVLVEGTPLRLLVGVAPDRDSALGLATALRAQHVETYVPRDGLRWSAAEAGGHAEWTNFLEAGDRLFDRLARFPSDALAGAKDRLPPKGEVEAMHRAFLQAGQPLAVGDGLREKRARAMMNALSQAVTAVRQFTANPHPEYLWQAEQGLLQYAVLRAAPSS